MLNKSRAAKPAVNIRQATDSGKEDGIEVIGTVVEKFRAGMFSIELELWQNRAGDDGRETSPQSDQGDEWRPGFRGAVPLRPVERQNHLPP